MCEAKYDISNEERWQNFGGDEDNYHTRLLGFQCLLFIHYLPKMEKEILTSKWNSLENSIKTFLQCST